MTAALKQTMQTLKMRVTNKLSALVDIALPSTITEVMNGLFLAAFVGFALSIGFTALFVFVRKRWKWSDFGIVLGCFVLSLIYGGILLFVIPAWIAIISLAIGIGGPILVLSRA